MSIETSVARVAGQIQNQTDLIAQIKTALADKAAGGGGESSGASGIYMAKITAAEDFGAINITHNLGTTDILFAGMWAETMGDVVPTESRGIMKVWFKTDIANVRGGYGWDIINNWDMTNNRGSYPGQPNSSAYWSKVKDENTFQFERTGSAGARYYAGVTYTVIIMAASAFKETEG